MALFGWVMLMVPAEAACEKELKALGAAQGPAVVESFKAVATCNPAAAGEAFAASAKRTGDVDSLGALARTAIGAGMTTQVHGLLELVPDYAAREETARLIGSWCTEDPAIETFLVGLHGALKDRAFVGWAGALRSCSSPALLQELERLAAAPPSQEFDDKYATVVDLYAAKRKAAALDVLEKAAVASADAGPFSVVIDAMVKAVTPEGLGGEPAEADKTALVDALLRISDSSEPEQVREVADALVGLDDTEAAGDLLPKLYPDRVQEGGSFLYGLAAVEQCGEAAVVHYAVVEDAGSRWDLAGEVADRVKSFKPKLKCGATLTAQVSPEPVTDADAVETWATSLSPGAKLKAYKAIVLE
jgi:hypothetical protein